MSDLRNNGRKKLLFLGVTGSGKSALCNVLSQPVKTFDTPPTLNFPETTNQRIGNTQTILKNIDFLGRNNENISFIDTVGFNSTEMNNTKIAELIVSLKDSCDFIHLFAIVVSCPKRIEASLKETIELFEGMFGKKRFWNNSVVIITNLPQSDVEISRRSMRNSDEQLIKDFNTRLVETFNLERFIPTCIIDAHYRGSKSDERDRFENTANSLWRLLMNSTHTGVSVRNVESVTGRLEGLQGEVYQEREERRKAHRKAEKAQREAEKAQREAENARKKAEKAEFTKNCVVGAGGAIVAAGLGIMAAPVLVPAAVTAAQAAAATAASAASAAAASATTAASVAAAAAASEGGTAAVVTATTAAAVALTR